MPIVKGVLHVHFRDSPGDDRRDCRKVGLERRSVQTDHAVDHQSVELVGRSVKDRPKAHFAVVQVELEIAVGEAVVRAREKLGDLEPAFLGTRLSVLRSRRRRLISPTHPDPRNLAANLVFVGLAAAAPIGFLVAWLS
jgi:hypothetical protein